MRKAILHLKRSDAVLGKLIERVGPYRMEFLEPVFETLVRSIVFQQLSGKVARVIFGRLQAAAQGEMTPEAILRLRPARMRALGLSKQKIEYIRDLARRTRSGDLDFTALPAMPDEEITIRLTRVKGIGVWTAQMFLIFALRRTNVLPTADLGIRAAIREVYGLDDLPTPAEIESLAAPWHPYCTIASWYLWRSRDGQAGL